MTHTLERVSVSVAGVPYTLAPTEHAEQIKTAVMDAVRAGGGFVELDLDNGIQLSVLITATSQVTVGVETADLDSDNADGESTGHWYPYTDPPFLR
ncbi:hypothetical protein [Microbacterium sp. LMI1-1-1.1]|uniref:hypothetical protein n=1 Tax=Microbacterium sp. LMI1-1-1.1 TaxID=3135223 RepID=UPI003467E3CD